MTSGKQSKAQRRTENQRRAEEKRRAEVRRVFLAHLEKLFRFPRDEGVFEGSSHLASVPAAWGLLALLGVLFEALVELPAERSCGSHPLRGAGQQTSA